MKPNLFSLATKELSQDAFIAWLIQWADPKYKTVNEPLNAVAQTFVKELISLQGDAIGQINKVEAGRQWDKIDIWAKVNDSHFIIIEDKVGTGEHSNQLARYRAIGEKLCQKNNYTLICIYIKTESDFEQNLDKVRNQGFAVLSRNKLLDLLKSHSVHNDIYTDFRDRLSIVEQTESQFDQKPIGDWKDGDWRGFYKALEGKRKVVKWSYVPNPAGGFWNLILNWFKVDGIVVYAQIEQGNLCFKVGEVLESRREIRGKYHHLLMSASLSESGLQRPSHFGNGAYMTVAFVPRNVWMGADNEVLNIDAVVSRLNGYESWLKSVLKID